MSTKRPPIYEKLELGPAARRQVPPLKAILAVMLVLLLAGGLFAWLQYSSQEAGKKALAEKNKLRPVPVTVASVIQKDVPMEVRAIGTVSAYSTIQVKSQVEGVLTRVLFKEGDYVKKGQLLFVIDPRSLEASVRQYQANLEKDMAQVNQAIANLERDRSQMRQMEANLQRDRAQQRNAFTEAERYAGLVHQGAVSQEQHDQILTNSKSIDATVDADLATIGNSKAVIRSDQAAIENARAVVRADQAAVENARVLLSYSEIRSPIDGRTGSLQVFQGNLVKASNMGDTLVTINQVQPIYVTFSVPERVLADITRYRSLGQLEVVAVIPGQEDSPVVGVLSFSENSVDATTGTIKLKATFPNEDLRLWPGLFVNVVLNLTTQKAAVLIPSQSVQSGQQGTYVFVVKPDKTVESRPIIVQRLTNKQAVVESGLLTGEIVVTDGQMNLIPGAHVLVKTAQTPPPRP